MPAKDVATTWQKLEYAGIRTMVAVLTHLPSRWARWLAGSGARGLYRLGGKRIEYVRANLRLAFPDLDPEERDRIGRESYAHIAWNLVDVARATRWSAEQMASRVTIVGTEQIEAALARGKGALGLTLHLGSFELAVRAAPVVGLPLIVVGRPFRNPLVRAWMNAHRTRTGAELIEHRNVAPRILRALRKGRLVVFLNDQYSRRSLGVFVPLFGARCSTSAGPAILALRSGAAVIPCYMLREGPDRHRLTFLPPVDWEPTGDREKDVEAATAACNAALEGIIREHPEQWMWSHRRFRHSPDLEGDLYA